MTKSSTISKFELGYKQWLYQNRLTSTVIDVMKKNISKFSYRPKFSIVMPVYNVEEKLLRLAIESVINQIYTNWELCIVDDASTQSHIAKTLEEYASKDARIKMDRLSKNEGIAGASNKALSLATGDFVGFLDNDDELYSDALYEVCNVLNENPKLDFIYTDEDKLEINGDRVEPYFKPDWSPDLLLSFGYINHFSVFRKSLLDDLNGLRKGFDGSQDYDLLLRATEKTSNIGHIPKPLYGWRKIPNSSSVDSLAKQNAQDHAIKALSEALTRRGIRANVVMIMPGLFRIRYELEKQSLVSIIILTHDQPVLLQNLLDSIENKTSYKKYEIIIVDRKSEKKETLVHLKNLNHRVIRYEKELNIADAFNYAVTFAKGEHFVFMNDDMLVKNEEWLEALLEHSQRKEVGIVGNLLLYPSDKGRSLGGKIQHAGLVLGYKSAAGHVFYQQDPSSDLYHNLHRVVRNLSAVTGACIMIEKSVFQTIGGWDTEIPITYNDIDLCMRIIEHGYRVIYTPFSQVYHYEGTTYGNTVNSDDEKKFIEKWKEKVVQRDPFYNENLSLAHEDYAVTLFTHNNPALSTLMELYYVRPDLQKVFPESDQGDYSRLIEWAVKYGIYEHPVLRPYTSWYKQCLNQILEKNSNK